MKLSELQKRVSTKKKIHVSGRVRKGVQKVQSLVKGASKVLEKNSYSSKPPQNFPKWLWG